MIEQFTKEEFEAGLVGVLNGTPFSCLGLQQGELVYTVPVADTNKRIVVRSTIDSTGIAAERADSIRVWVEYWHKKSDRWAALGKDSKSWTTRLPGWPERLRDRLRAAWAIAMADSKPKARVESNGESCPKCEAGMVLRTRGYDGNQFWGCSMFPKCKGTKNYEEPREEPAAEIKKLIWSDNQKAVFEFVANSKRHGVVKAVAGSGKTSTAVEGLNHTSPDSMVGYVAFNKRIATELARRAPSHAHVSTNHSLGFGNIRAAQGKVKVNSRKLYFLLRDIGENLPTAENNVIKENSRVIQKLVSLTKANMMEPTTETFEYIADRWNIDTNGEGELIYRTAAQLFKQSTADMSVVDFDDMIWFPASEKVPCKKFDVLFIDEAQDLNKAQASLMMNSLNPDGRIVAFGDEFQSVYGFAGADSDSIPNLIKSLDAETLPLSITYRCPKSHVALAQSLVPQIEAAPWAKEGTLETVSQHQFAQGARTGDMVLCRCNAPLVGPAFSLIRRGTKAVILGRDIGKSLMVLISKAQKKAKVHSLSDTLAALIEHGEREVSKLTRMKKHSRAQSIEDRVETIIALSDGCSTMSQLEEKIETIFSDEAEGVTFSSVHKAKGLEANTVWILRDDLMPHPKAEAPWELQQEANIRYVAYTRSKSRLFFVEDD